MNSIISEINNGKGFISLNKVDSEIHSYIQNSIENTLKDLLICKNLFRNNPGEKILDSYKYIPDQDWGNLFNKKSRTLRKSYSLNIQNYFTKYLEKILNVDVEIRDILKLGYPSFAFRIVRPFNSNDIGAMHADQWFIDIGETKEEKLSKSAQLLKFWLPIEVDSRTSNLLLIPDSHKKRDNYKYDVLETKTGLKPVIKNNLNKNDIHMIDNKNGNPVIFHMDLIHGGALNKSKNCRISLEFEFSIFY